MQEFPRSKHRGCGQDTEGQAADVVDTGRPCVQKMPGTVSCGWGSHSAPWRGETNLHPVPSPSPSPASAPSPLLQERRGRHHAQPSPSASVGSSHGTHDAGTAPSWQPQRPLLLLPVAVLKAEGEGAGINTNTQTHTQHPRESLLPSLGSTTAMGTRKVGVCLC